MSYTCIYKHSYILRIYIAILLYISYIHCLIVQFSPSLSCVRLFVTPWTAACQASLSITSSQSLLKLMSIESVMPSNHLILCCPLLLPPSIFPSIRVFSNESVLCIKWSKYWVEIEKPHEFPQASVVNVGKMPVETNDLKISEILLSGLCSHIIFFF